MKKPRDLTRFRLLRRSLAFHARAHLGTLLGSGIGAAVLIGALVVGDSVRGSLRELALLRLGKAELAMATGDRLFTARLAGALQQGLAQMGLARPAPPPVAPVLQLPAVAVNSDGSARANQVQLLGVDARFWQLAPTAFAPGEIAADAVVLNAPLAAQLGAKTGDTVLLRVQKPQALSADAPLSPEENQAVALRLRVQAIAGDAQFGRFGLQASQVAPHNAFVSLAMLQGRVATPDRANLLLVGPAPPQPLPQGTMPGVAGSVMVWSGTAPVNLAEASATLLTQRWTLADAQLEFRAVANSRALDLRSSRVFLDAALGDAIFGGTNPLAARVVRDLPGVIPGGVLTYFVNELRVGDRTTPYSMVTAANPPLTPPGMKDDEILINAWLAEDLHAQAGDELALRYFVVGAGRQLEEKSATFRVRAVLPMNAPGLDRDLMPDFPGLTDAENCRDWDTGLPIDNGRIRPRDEEYWRQYRGTPKAVITLAAGQRLWENRFGNLTAVRFQLPNLQTPTPGAASRSIPTYASALSTLLTRSLDPAMFGLRFEDVRAQALASSTQSQDFGQLFLGFSFFLIVAALLLLAVLFQFSIEQRAGEVGTLLALGFRPAQARRLILLEGGLVALAGCVLGAWAGVGYARLMLRGLSTVWREAVGGTALAYHVEPATLGIGVGAAACACWLTMHFALRKIVRTPARQLLAEGVIEDVAAEGAPGKAGRAKLLAAALAAGAITLAAAGIVTRAAEAGLFFGAGALLLAAGLTGCSAWLRELGGRASAARLTLKSLGVRSATRRRRRSLAVVGLLACGSFLIASIGVFRLDASRDATSRTSGTGGFALIGESTQPVVHDLNTAGGRDVYGLDTNILAGVSVVPFRVRDGDDASCLNLNRAQTPRLLGVNSRQLANRGAFTFAALADGVDAKQPWLALRRGDFQPSRERPLAEDEVAAIGDQASIQWALGKKVGDTLEYTDERGRPFKLRIVGAVANSILQGNLLIDEAEFVRRFPSASGYRYLLVDVPAGRAPAVAAELTRGLRDFGLAMTPAAERLAAFNAVQNTYLGTFQVLGGLGLLLGSAGLGVVVLRNVLERRGELALLLALGFRSGALRQLVLSEHLALLVAGLGVGVAAAIVAVLPGVVAGGGAVPYASLGVTLLAILANGAAWTWLAAELALRGPLLGALRNA